jgi:hypothetical protein
MFPLRQACECLFQKDYAKMPGKAKGRFSMALVLLYLRAAFRITPAVNSHADAG